MREKERIMWFSLMAHVHGIKPLISTYLTLLVCVTLTLIGLIQREYELGFDVHELIL